MSAALHSHCAIATSARCLRALLGAAEVELLAAVVLPAYVTPSSRPPEGITGTGSLCVAEVGLAMSTSGTALCTSTVTLVASTLCCDEEEEVPRALVRRR